MFEDDDVSADLKYHLPSQTTYAMRQLAVEIDEADKAVGLILTAVEIGEYTIYTDNSERDGYGRLRYMVSSRLPVYKYCTREHGPAQALWRAALGPFPTDAVFEALFETWLQVRGQAA